ncbi:AAA family ATPase [Nonomuraea typhae]|uniref:AAA family ATPase n=1 Tax=Nonomuraea typhae TaxID=2603600 RepID=A0ABW7Z8L9_9ACTN
MSDAACVSPLPGDDHYLRLRDASLIATEGMLTAKENLQVVIKVRGMMCLYGDAGVGKTLSVNASLRDLAPQQSLRVEFRSHPYPRDIREVLFEGLGLAGRQPRRAGQFDRMLKDALRQEFRVLVCDEAQWLSRECFELWRHLWDDRDTQIAIVFVGGHNCYDVLRREPMLASRVTIWQELQRLTREQVLAVIPGYHPIWRRADPEDILHTDVHAAHGNFRRWAKITVLAAEAMARLGRDTIDRQVLAWVFSKLGGG